MEIGRPGGIQLYPSAPLPAPNFILESRRKNPQSLFSDHLRKAHRVVHGGQGGGFFRAIKKAIKKTKGKIERSIVRGTSTL